MTIREALKGSLDTYMEKGVKFGDEEQEPFEMLPLPFPYFLESMAFILTYVTLNQNYDNPMKEKITGKELMGLMNPSELSGPSFQRTQLVYDFIRWFLDQEAVQDVKDGEMTMWYDLDFVLNAWNKRAAEKMAEEDEDEEDDEE